ncbi:MAG: glutathione S-transferase N-terminal domain-containing protein [Nitrospirota bacterium]
MSVVLPLAAASSRVIASAKGGLVLYELSAKGDRRFSPFCWKARMALAHKELTPECIPVGFTDKETIAFSGQDRVPVLVDHGETISDSWDIACHLENKYPNSPTLFGGEAGRSLTRFVDLWATRTMFPHLVRLVLCDVLDHLDEQDAVYVRRTREKQLGVTFEQLRAERDTHREAFTESLGPMRSQLRREPYLAGSNPGYADYAVFGSFQWARMISPYRVLERDDPVHGWRGRMLDLFDGLAARAPGYPI